MTVQWNPNFAHQLSKNKLVPMIERFENLGVKLHCLTHEVRFSLNHQEFQNSEVLRRRDSTVCKFM